ncbi:MAG: hypothetical protein ACI8TX_000997, partial [Hyphomicrobiaceae bacterium]
TRKARAATQAKQKAAQEKLAAERERAQALANAARESVVPPAPAVVQPQAHAADAQAVETRSAASERDTADLAVKRELGIARARAADALLRLKANLAVKLPSEPPANQADDRAPTLETPAATTRPVKIPGLGDSAETPSSNSFSDITDELPVGLMINAANVANYAQFTGPAIQWLVENGVTLEVGPYKTVRNPPPFIEATERYAAQVKISEDSTHLINHVAGLPFPNVNANDRQVAAKLMYNFNSAIARDDLDLRNFECNTGTLGRDGDPVRIERTFVVNHLRRLFFTERTTVAPFPELQPNRDRVRYKEALLPLLEPFDLKGVGVATFRYLDHTRQDDSWLYLPQLRRARRLSSSQRSDALFGQDTDQDSFAGYAGNVGWFDWKLLGEKTVLATFHETGIPVDWGPPSGDFIHKGTWEPRQVWVVEGASKLRDYAYSKRVIYIDKESWRIPFSDLYDRDGELWKVWVNSFKFATHPYPGARYGFDYEIPYEPSISMVDLQARHATYCALPGRRFPGEQGWYVNLGESEGTVESFFDISSIIASGR